MINMTEPKRLAYQEAARPSRRHLRAGGSAAHDTQERVIGDVRIKMFERELRIAFLCANRDQTPNHSLGSANLVMIVKAIVEHYPCDDHLFVRAKPRYG